MNVLSEADGAALALYCWNVEMFRRCSDEIAKTKGADGMVMETPSGYQQVRPHATLAQQFQKQALAILKEFGLTPSARTSVGKIEVAEKKSEAESVLG